jgi:hypothetical protein
MTSRIEAPTKESRFAFSLRNLSGFGHQLFDKPLPIESLRPLLFPFLLVMAVWYSGSVVHVDKLLSKGQSPHGQRVCRIE